MRKRGQIMNIKDTIYTVEATLKDGSNLDVTPAVQSLQWQAPAEEIAQRATIVLAQTKTKKGLLHSLAPLCTLIVIKANGTEVFRGVVWEWEYSSGSAQDITLTCYDHFIYAQRSKSFSYYAAGKGTKELISDLCGKNGIKLDYKYESIKHAKIVYRSAAVSDQILDTLDEAKRQLKTAPVALFDKQTLIIRPKGQNKDVYVFEAAKNAVQTTERMTLDKLVTKVVVMGKEDKAGRRKIEAAVAGDTRYGVLQEVVYRDGDDTIAAAKAEAQKIIDERGKPDHIISVEAPDVPFIQKGDKVKMAAGSLVGYYFVKGVTHSAHDRMMTMELEVTA